MSQEINIRDKDEPMSDEDEVILYDVFDDGPAYISLMEYWERFVGLRGVAL